MCQFTSFVYLCCGASPHEGDASYYGRNPICTEPCTRTRTLPDPTPKKGLPKRFRGRYHRLLINRNCPNRKNRIVHVDAKCRLCRDAEDGVIYDPELEFPWPSKRSQRIQPERMYAAVTDLDSPDLRSLVWYVPPMELKRPDLFRPIQWDSPAALELIEVPVSPKTHAILGDSSCVAQLAAPGELFDMICSSPGKKAEEQECWSGVPLSPFVLADSAVRASAGKSLKRKRAGHAVGKELIR